MTEVSGDPAELSDDKLKSRTAKTVKWNMLDRLSTQVLYAVTGIVLARELTQEDFGLVGALLVFQAFASLLVNSGFSFALIQRKNMPSRLDYSSVLWFNMGVAVLIYLILFFCAPLIADIYQHDTRLIPLSRVMFLTFVFNAAGIVQTSMMLKRMEAKYVAVSNCIGLAIGGVTGIVMAVTGFGAWALVWQAVIGAAVKALVLWTAGKWVPLLKFSWKAIRSFMGISLKMMFNSFLNILFQNIFAFFIGNRVGMVSLGYYTQSDKWSKMGFTSLTGMISASFLPALSAVQDQPERYRRVATKMARFTYYLSFPCLIWLAVMATPIFHLLFGEKWDPSIILFQLLLVRGVFMVLNELYVNFLLSLGFARQLIWLEVIRDGAAILALVATFPFLGLTRPDDPVYGLTIMLWTQVGATFVTWVVSMAVTARYTHIPIGRILLDMFPYLGLTLAVSAAMWLESLIGLAPIWTLIIQGITALVLYVGILGALKSQIQKDVFAQLGLESKLARFRRQK